MIFIPVITFAQTFPLTVSFFSGNYAWFEPQSPQYHKHPMTWLYFAYCASQGLIQLTQRPSCAFSIPFCAGWYSRPTGVHRTWSSCRRWTQAECCPASASVACGRRHMIWDGPFGWACSWSGLAGRKVVLGSQNRRCCRCFQRIQPRAERSTVDSQTGYRPPQCASDQQWALWDWVFADRV